MYVGYAKRDCVMQFAPSPGFFISRLNTGNAKMQSLFRRINFRLPFSMRLDEKRPNLRNRSCDDNDVVFNPILNLSDVEAAVGSGYTHVYQITRKQRVSKIWSAGFNKLLAHCDTWLILFPQVLNINRLHNASDGSPG